MGFFSRKKEIREAKEAAGAVQYAGAASMEAASAQTARNIAAEETKHNVFSLLGAPGTYGPGAAGAASEGSGGLWDTSGEGLSQADQNLRQGMAYSTGKGTGPNAKNYKAGLLNTPRSGVLDPDAAANEISKSASFRIQSQQVAESEQLLNQEGPAWDMLENSIFGTINEGAALQLRDSMRQLKNNAAKGGSARRTALNEANQMLAGERSMRTKVQETWQANLKLHDYVRQNADRVAQGSARFMDNLPLVNDAYRNAMQKGVALQIEGNKVGAATSLQAYQVVAAQKTAFEMWADTTVQLVSGAAQIAAAYYTGGMSSGITSEVGSSAASMSKQQDVSNMASNKMLSNSNLFSKSV